MMNLVLGTFTHVAFPLEWSFYQVLYLYFLILIERYELFVQFIS